MSRFLTIAYWLSSSKAIETSTLNVLAFVFTALIALSVYFRYASAQKRYKEYKNLFLKLSHFFISIGIIGDVLVFMSSQRIPYLGLRAYYLILGIVALIWGISILRYFYNKLPLELNEKQRMEAFQKYLPRKK